MEIDASTKKNTLQGVFDRSSSIYGTVRYFPILGQWLVDMAQIPTGAKVLDVACGRGAVLIPAARQVGPSGQVIGIDLSAGMVQATTATLREYGLTQAQALQMDAEQIDFPDASFDYVLCGFSLQFLPHLTQGLSEFRRVLKPSGQVVVTTWGEDDERWNWYDDLCATYQADVKLGSQSLDKPEKIFPWFRQAAFTQIQTHTTELDMVYAEPDEWWTMRWSLSGRAGLERLEPAQLEQFKAEVFAYMETMREADGFHDRLQAHCTIAVKP